jgi:hypothetical protein
MKKTRISALPMLIVVAVVALVVGSFGPAVAKPVLSKGKIKSIATKVIKKQAPSLSVAHAKTADNANNLNGQPGSAYQSPAIRFRLPTGGAATSSKAYTLNGVSAGNYQFDYTVFGVSSAQVACYLQAAGISSTAEGYNGGSNSTFSTPSGSGVVTVGATAPVLNCYGTSGQAFSLYNSTQ